MVIAAVIGSGVSSPAATTKRRRASRPTSTVITTATTTTTTMVKKVTTSGVSIAASMALTSPVMSAGGSLPVAYTCDGASRTPPLQWTPGPKGTVSYAVVMHHVAGPGDTHWYWVLYNIASTVTQLDDGVPPPATVGTNSVNRRTEYTPPCSKGPGAKEYIFTVYALSKAPALSDPIAVTRQVLLDAMEGSVLASSTLSVTYSRP